MVKVKAKKGGRDFTVGKSYSRRGKPWWLLIFRGELVVCETKFIN